MSLAIMTAPIEAPVLPELDRPDAGELADQVLLSSAATVKVATVRAGTSQATPGQPARVSTSTRAWTRGGAVD